MTPDVLDEFNLRLQHHMLRIDLGDFTRIRLRRDPGAGDSPDPPSIGMTGPERSARWLT